MAKRPHQLLAGSLKVAREIVLEIVLLSLLSWKEAIERGLSILAV